MPMSDYEPQLLPGSLRKDVISDLLVDVCISMGRRNSLLLVYDTSGDSHDFGG